MMLMGGPIDTRINPTAVNKLAEERGIDWFRRNVITKVPFPHPGVMRDVYPGFLQLNGFVSMNLDRHLDAHKELFFHLVQGRRRFRAEASRVLRRISRGDGSDRRVLSADGRDRVRAPRAAEGRDDASRPPRSIRQRSATSRCSPSRARRTTFPASARPRRRIGCASTSRRSARRTTCSSASAITACSTARASAPKSRRASPTSSSSNRACRQSRSPQPRSRLPARREPRSKSTRWRAYRPCRASRALRRDDAASLHLIAVLSQASIVDARWRSVPSTQI